MLYINLYLKFIYTKITLFNSKSFFKHFNEIVKKSIINVFITNIQNYNFY